MIGTLRPYERYELSSIPWLEQVPRHWAVSPGLSGYTTKSRKNIGLQEETVLSLSYGRIVVKPKEKLFGLVPASFGTYQVVSPGDIIVRATDLQNDKTSLRVGIVRDQGIITSAYLCLVPTSALDSEYGYWLLHAYDLTKILYLLGSGLRQNLDYSDFKRLPIPVPPADEQRIIARYCTHVDNNVSRLIRNKRRLIALLNEEKQAIIQQAVTRGLDPNVPMKPSGVEWLGEIPAHWEIKALKHVLRSLIDCEHKTAPVTDLSEYLVVRTTAVRHGQLRLSGTYCTTAESFEEWTQRGLPEPDDVIFTREAPAGEACIVPKDYKLCLGQRTVLMKLRHERYDPQFLVHMLYGGPPSHHIQIASQGSTVGHFNMSDIAALRILVPPRLEQGQIVGAIRQRTYGLDAAIASSEREIDLIREYRTRLIADIVTGQLDVREAAASLPDIEDTEVDSLLTDTADLELAEGDDLPDEALDLSESADAAD